MTGRWRGADRGSIAPVVPLFALVLLLLGGLVIDASRLLNARGRAVAYAEEAARAGASAVRAGSATLGLDEAGARARVDGFCAALLTDDEQSGGIQECRFVAVEAVGGPDSRRIVVRVFVALQIPATLLGIVGVQTFTASGEARARPFEGVDADDVDSLPPDVDVQLPQDPPGAPPDVDVPVAPEPPPLPPVPTPPDLPVPTPTEPGPEPTPTEPGPEPEPEPAPVAAGRSDSLAGP